MVNWDKTIKPQNSSRTKTLATSEDIQHNMASPHDQIPQLVNIQLSSS